MLRSRKACWMADRSIYKRLFYTTAGVAGLLERGRKQASAVETGLALRLYEKCGKKYCNANERLWQSQPAIGPAKIRCTVLRAVFIALSESRWLRALAERSRLGQRTSARFVAGTQVADAVRAAAAVNQFGAGVSIDNLGENVTNADEARASAQLYHHLLDEIAADKLNAN